MRRLLALTVAVVCLFAVPASAQVAFDAWSRDTTPGVGDQSYTHTPVGTPRGVIVFVGVTTSADEITGATYGGTAMTEMTGSPNLLAGGEQGGAHAYFLGASVPTGAQTVAITTSASVGTNQIYTITLTAGGNTEIVDVDATVNSASAANPSVTLSLTSRTSFAALVAWSGQNAVADITELAGWTNRHEITTGTESIGNYTYDTVSTADVTAGWTQAAEDAVMIAVAVAQVAGGGSDLNPGGLGLLGAGR